VYKFSQRFIFASSKKCILREFIFASSKKYISRGLIFANFVFYKFSRGFIFTKQTKYSIKQKLNGPKINESFMRKRTITLHCILNTQTKTKMRFSYSFATLKKERKKRFFKEKYCEDLCLRIKAFQIFCKDLMNCITRNRAYMIDTQVREVNNKH